MQTALIKIVFIILLIAALVPALAQTPLNSSESNLLLWNSGQNAFIHFTGQFYCVNPTASNSLSVECTANQFPVLRPALNRTLPSIFFLWPYGFIPNPSTVSCNTLGGCLSEPQKIDFSSFLGPEFANQPTPIHTYLADTSFTDNPDWWNVRLVIITNPAAWNLLSRSKNLSTLKQLQQDNQGVGPDITTNIFLHLRPDPTIRNLF